MRANDGLDVGSGPAENPGMVAGACMCDADRERDALADRVSGLHF